MDITPILTLSDNLSGVDSSKTTVTISTNGEPQTVQQGATIPLYTLPLGSHTFIVTASDLAGNTSSQTVLFQTTTSIQSLQALVTRFTNAGWIDNAGIANSLQSKLAKNNLADFRERSAGAKRQAYFCASRRLLASGCPVFVIQTVERICLLPLTDVSKLHNLRAYCCLAPLVQKVWK